MRLPLRHTAIAAVLSTALLAVGCGGGGSSSSATGRPSAATFGKQFVAFAACMRSHGLLAYPDPQVSSSGGQVHVKISPGATNPNTPAFKSADRACHKLLPDGGSPGATAANQGQEHAQGVRFANCMRSHGVPNFPDPDHDGAFDLGSDINQQAPQFQRAMHDCASARPSAFLINQLRGAKVG
jgi:hypothetical protein